MSISDIRNYIFISRPTN